MPALAHLGVGLAAKQLVPRISVWFLMISAMVIDIVAIFTSLTWMSHGLFMSIIWTLASMVVAALITRYHNSRNSEDKNKLYDIKQVTLLIGLLVFSHWVLDFIGWPMTIIKPNWTGVPIFFSDTPNIGLGVYNTWLGALSMEIGFFVIGLVLYMKARKKK